MTASGLVASPAPFGPALLARRLVGAHGSS
jgi:hypothetical protein